MQTGQTQHQLDTLRLLSLAWLLACILLPALSAQAATSGRNTATGEARPEQGDGTSPAIPFQQADDIPAMLRAGKIRPGDIPDPHWKKNGCIACHKSTAANAGADNLRHENVEEGCFNCHSPAYDHSYIHPVNVRPDRRMLDNMAPEMRAVLAGNGNRVGCTSCHDMSLQCRTGSREKSMHPKFFRGGPYESRSQLCFSCHDREEYQRLNPHDQVDDNGRLRPEKCYVCHADSIGRLKHVTEIDQMVFHAEDSLASMCWGCHPWTPHPGGQFTFFKDQKGPNHLIKPPDNIRQRMQETAEEEMIYFPLEPGSGKIFCATCHNVHEKGVIADPVKARGADSEKRLRDQKICEYCHLK